MFVFLKEIDIPLLNKEEEHQYKDTHLFTTKTHSKMPQKHTVSLLEIDLFTNLDV